MPPNDLVPAADLPPLPPLPGGNAFDSFPSESEGPSQSVGLTRRQKAAIVVRVVLGEGDRLPLDTLPEEIQTALTVEMAGMKSIDRNTLEAVANEFAAEIQDLGLSFPTGIENALGILDGSISEATARRIRNQAGLDTRGDPWERILTMEAQQLLPVMENESIEVAAVVLSKLKVSTAAQLLGLLPGERARRITYAVSRTGGVAPSTVTAIGHAIATQLDAHDPTAFSEGPVGRVGAILNFAPSATREDVLNGLQETDGDFAEQVRKAIFTFANIPGRIDARDVPKIIRDIDQSDLVKAIAGSQSPGDEAAAEFLLGNISQRMADNLREEASELGGISSDEADTAMNAVVSVIRALETEGEIFLIAEDD